MRRVGFGCVIAAAVCMVMASHGWGWWIPSVFLEIVSLALLWSSKSEKPPSVSGLRQGVIGQWWFWPAIVALLGVVMAIGSSGSSSSPSQPVATTNPSITETSSHTTVRGPSLTSATPVQSSISVSSLPSPHQPSSVQTVAYTPPIDGVWPDYAESGHGEFALGQPVTLPNAGASGWPYTVTVLGPPSFVSNGKSVSVSAKILVKRVKDDGLSGSIAGSVVVVFVPGNIVPSEGIPLSAYTSEARIGCNQDILAVKQSETCTVVVQVSSQQITNFFWWVGPSSSYSASAAAWPGQKA